VQNTEQISLCRIPNKLKLPASDRSYHTGKWEEDEDTKLKAEGCSKKRMMVSWDKIAVLIQDRTRQ
jgi:hypothetical protein